MAALATPADLCTRLGVETPAEDSLQYEQLEALLNDASGELRAVIGQNLDRDTSTIWIYPEGSERRGYSGREVVMSYVTLPAVPVVEVAEVKIGDEVVPTGEYFIRYRTLYVPFTYYDAEIEITYTHGFDPLPDELVKWTCVLAASTLSAAEKTGALGTTAGISQHSRTIDDYTESWANYSGYKAPGMSLPPEVGVRLRALYGGGGVEVLAHR